MGITFGEGLGPNPGFASDKSTRSYKPGEEDRAEKDRIRDRLETHLGKYPRSKADRIRAAFESRDLDDARSLYRAVTAQTGAVKAKKTKFRKVVVAAKKAKKLEEAVKCQGALTDSRWMLVTYLKKTWERNLVGKAEYSIQGNGTHRIRRLESDPTDSILEVFVADPKVPIAYVRVRVFEEGQDPFGNTQKKVAKNGWFRDSWGRRFYVPVDCRDAVRRIIGGFTAKPRAPKHSEVGEVEHAAVLRAMTRPGDYKTKRGKTKWQPDPPPRHWLIRDPEFLTNP